MKSLLPFFALLLANLALSAQEMNTNFCGTPAEKSKWLIQYQQNPELYPVAELGITYVPLTVHVVGTDDGTGFFPADKVLNALCVLNEDFAASEIQFFLKGPIRYLANSNYYEHNFQGGSQMMNNYNVYGSINCYIVQDPAGNCGYYSYNGDAVALKKGCIGPGDHTWAHELGHFLSLPHTFFGWENLPNFDYSQNAPVQIDNVYVERANGSNCSFAADGFCDTPADYLNYRWSCDVDSWSTTEQKDPQGNVFKSDGTYFMSYALDHCSGKFSAEQNAAMHANLQYQRPELLTNQNSPIYVTEVAELLSPGNEDSVFPDAVTLEWQAVPNAAYYIVEVSRLSNFPFLTHQAIVSGTSFSINDLTPDKSYYWRVKPFGKYDFACEGADPLVFTFTTDALTSSVPGGAKLVPIFEISPNPTKGGSEVTIQVSHPHHEEATLKLANLHGQLVQKRATSLQPGLNYITVQLPNLPAGMYLLSLETAAGTSLSRLLIE